MKKFLMRLCILVAVFSFYSCGNALLDFMGKENPPQGGGGGSTSNTGTTEPHPAGAIYIDTQDEFKDFYVNLGSTKYPLDGVYVLRANKVQAPTFILDNSISSSFIGKLYGWYKDEDKKTTIKITSGNSMFTGGMQNAAVFWLKFDATTIPVTSNSKVEVGIVANTATKTEFEQVTVTGTVSVSVTGSSDPFYVGGIVGKAYTGTSFKECNARASVSVTYPSTSTKNCYAGGIAGYMAGSVEDSFVSVLSGYSPPPLLTVSAKIEKGTGMAYAGGVTGILEGGTIKNTVVRANVTATGEGAYGGGFAGFVDSGNIWYNTSDGNLTVEAISQGEKAYGGGFAGFVDSGNISNNTLNGNLTVEATSDTTVDTFAGGLAGLSNTSLVNNDLYGTVAVTSKYNGGISYSGGLVGKLTGNTNKIENSLVNGSVTVQSYPQSSSAAGTAYAGGLAGYSEGNITNSSFSSNHSYGAVSAGFSYNYFTSTVEVAAADAYAGGIAGYAKEKIDKSYVNVDAVINDSYMMGSSPAGIDARVSGDSGIAAAGGIVGKNEKAIDESYAVVTVKARAKKATNAGEGATVGGISGISEESITNTFALAKVDARPVDTSDSATSKAMAGGIAGYLTGGSIETSYAAGSVVVYVTAANAHAGGIVGYIELSSGTAIIKNCVALQKYVASDGTNHHRVAGYLSGPTIAGAYAYNNMTSATEGGSFGISSPDASNADGDNISATNAKDFTYYTSTLSWSNPSSVWKGLSLPSYPILTNLLQPDTPSWAEISIP